MAVVSISPVLLALVLLVNLNDFAPAVAGRGSDRSSSYQLELMVAVLAVVWPQSGILSGPHEALTVPGAERSRLSRGIIRASRCRRHAAAASPQLQVKRW